MRNFITGKLLAIIGVLCVAIYLIVQTIFPEKGMDNLPPQERLNLKKNIIVLGVDERPEEFDVGRSDTLFVVMFDTATKNASLLSIPRDTRVRIPDHGWDKINHAYPYGGRELTQKTTEEFLGIHINNYVMVDFKGFTGLVDAIGGVDIDIEEDMYYKDTWDGFTIDLKKGHKHLDGKTAIQYVRFRDEEGDIGRVRRQQRFLMAAYEKIANADMILKVPGLAKQLTSMVKTDLPLKDMLSLGRALHSMVKEKGLAVATVPGEGRYINEISYYIPDVRGMREQVAKMQGAEMTERYKTAAETMANEYDYAIKKVEAGDHSGENKDAIEKEKKIKELEKAKADAEKLEKKDELDAKGSESMDEKAKNIVEEPKRKKMSSEEKRKAKKALELKKNQNAQVSKKAAINEAIVVEKNDIK